MKKINSEYGLNKIVIYFLIKLLIQFNLNIWNNLIEVENNKINLKLQTLLASNERYNEKEEKFIAKGGCGAI